MKKILLLLSCLWLCLIGTSQTTARYAEEDPLLLILQKEMNEQFLFYSQKSTPILRMWFEVTESEQHKLGVCFGSVDKDKSSTSSKILGISMVVGTEDVNNYTFNRDDNSFEINLPLVDDPDVLHRIIAQGVNILYEREAAAYRSAEIVHTLQKNHRHYDVPALVDTFHYEPRVTTNYNHQELVHKMSDCTRDYLQVQDVASCRMDMNYTMTRSYRIDNAGSLIVSNTPEAAFEFIITDISGGKESQSYQVENPDDLPPVDILRKEAAERYGDLLSGNPTSTSIFHRIRPYDAEMDNYTTATPDGLFRALQDEIDANLDALRIDESYPPYYISYLVSDAEIVSLQSAWGHALNHKERNVRSVFPTVRIGMDLLNNEHFRLESEQCYRLPLHNDYNALRSTLWTATHSTYMESVANFMGKQKHIQHNGIDESKLPADRSVEQTQNVIQHKQYEPLNTEDIQDHLDDISSVFFTDSIFRKKITNAVVSCNSYRSNVYFLASDGVQYAQPFHFVKIHILAETKNQNGETLNDYQDFLFSEINEEIHWDTLKVVAYRLGHSLIERSQTSQIVEEYNGPVLFLAQAVAETFNTACTSSATSLINQRDEMVIDEGFIRSTTLSESQINQLITSSIFDIYAKDQMETFDGQTLIGAYTIDADGVPVDKKTQLVHRGELISLLTNREATASHPNSNGHQRFWITSYDNEGVYATTGAGVLVLSSHNKMSYDKLEKALRKQARDAGYRHAYIVERVLGSDWWFYNCIAYRIDVRTGKKTPVQEVSIQYPTLWQYRTAMATSDQENCRNTLASKHFGGWTATAPISIITPSAILFKNWQISIY